jgi:hypothetical protein
VKLATFTSDKPGKSEILCRGAAMIQTPGGVPFERYERTPSVPSCSWRAWRPTLPCNTH